LLLILAVFVLSLAARLMLRKTFHR
jgi:hypothetical protein